jgi:CRP-like cAMP-binding protein
MTENRLTSKIQNYLPQIRLCPLFRGIAPDNLESMLSCLNARLAVFGKGETVIREGTSVKAPGILLSGSVHATQTDFWGNTSIMAEITPPNLFGETYACLSDIPSEVTVTAAENETAVLFVDMARMRSPCESACGFHKRLLANLLVILSGKNLYLTGKLTHVTQRTTRAKLLSYFSDEAAKAGNAAFTIPFNRQELADYLAVERTALSAELGRMRDDGLITFDKNEFTLLSKQ